MIKSPVNYTGGKFKLLPQILPLFPNKIDKFVDLFGGGMNVSVNVNAEKIYVNDTLTQVIDLFKTLHVANLNLLLSEFDWIIKNYNLSKEGSSGYKRLRDEYNNSKDSLIFYMLICHSFNNQIRFNKKQEFNLPFGKRTFGTKLREIFIEFVTELQKKEIEFSNNDFRNFDISDLTSRDFIYADPPYLISCATYNDMWSEKEEVALLDLLDLVNSKKVKFALSNVLDNKGKENLILKEWSHKYNVHLMDKSYTNCNYHRVKGDASTEVLITNY